MDKGHAMLSKYASLMSSGRQEVIGRFRQRREVSIQSQMSAVSVASSSISDFLEDRITQLVSEREMLQALKEGLFELREAKDLEEDSFQVQLQSVIGAMHPISRNLQVLKKQKRTIEQDMEEELASVKRGRGDEPDLEFYERAYTSSIVPRVMGASGQMRKTSKTFTKHDQSRFRTDVLTRYASVRGEGISKVAYCHVSGWWPLEKVTAAHLVPKSLSCEEISFLFGVQEVPLTDARNGISLHKNIELALDTGKIVIIPSVNRDGLDQKWKCVLVDQNAGNDVAYGRFSFERQGEPKYSETKWKGIDGKELEFLTPNRPAKRFLYFRFIITYIYAKSMGNTAFTSTVESRHEFWASPGQYLERSTLKSLARNISGLELPPSVIERQTFENESTSAAESDITGMSLAAEVRAAVVASAKRLEQHLDEEEWSSGDGDESAESENDYESSD